jgi:hypothetical protein
VAADTERDRHVMSQTSYRRCGLVAMRWLPAGGDLSRPNQIHQSADRPLMRSERTPKCLLHSPCRHRGSPRADVPPIIEIGANIKSP